MKNILQGIKPNQSGTFSNRTNFGTDEKDLFVVEFNHKTELTERAEIVGLIRALPDLLEFTLDFINKVETGRAKSVDSYNKAKLAVEKAKSI